MPFRWPHRLVRGVRPDPAGMPGVEKAPRPRLLAISKALPARLAKLDARGIRVVEDM